MAPVFWDRGPCLPPNITVINMAEEGRRQTDHGSLNPLLLIPSTAPTWELCALEECWVGGRGSWLGSGPCSPTSSRPLASFFLCCFLGVRSSFSSQWSPWQWELPRHLGRKCFIPSILVTGPTRAGLQVELWSGPYRRLQTEVPRMLGFCFRDQVSYQGERECAGCRDVSTLPHESLQAPLTQ